MHCSTGRTVTRIPIMRVELITISIATMRSIWHNSAADFFSVLENFRRKFANLVAPYIDGTTKRLERCKAHQVLLKASENNVQLDT